MPSTAITAQGITIARFGTTTFETIPNVVSFQGPGGQASVIDGDTVEIHGQRLAKATSEQFESARLRIRPAKSS